MPQAHAFPYKVQDGESLRSIATAFRMDVANLIWFNFRTKDPQVINWYLFHHVGCRQLSSSGTSFSFRTTDRPGIIWVPGALAGTSTQKEVAAKPQPQARQKPIERCPYGEGIRCLTRERAANWLDGLSKKTSYERQRGFHTWVIKYGLLVPSAEGERLVYGVTSHEVLFLMNGGYCLQYASEFVEDIAMGAEIEGFRSAEGMVILYELEMKFFMGLAAATSGVGFVAVATAKLGEFLSENDIRGLVTKLLALYAAIKALKTVAPSLHDKLFSLDTAFSMLWETIKRLPKALTELSAEDVAQLLGSIVGKLGKATVLTLFKVALSVATAVLTFIATGLLPKAGKVLAEEKVRMAKELVQGLQAVGLTASREEAEQIVEEILENPEKVREIMTNLKKGLAN